MSLHILSDRRTSDKPYRAFCEGWRDVAEQFISTLWHDPAKGHDAAIDARLGPESFPEPVLWALVRLLAACAVTGAEPDTDFIGQALRDLGEHVEGPDLERIKWRHCSSVSVERYAAKLADFARRRVLHDRLGLLQQSTLDTYEPIGDLAERVLSDIEAWQSDGSSLPEPPEIKRPPAIHVTHTLRMAERISA